MLEHGGNIGLVARQYGIQLEDWLDLSTGINPEGYPIPYIPPAIWQRLPLDEPAPRPVQYTMLDGDAA